MRIVRHLVRHGIAYVALLTALGGTSFAAANALVARNSVGSRQVRDRSLLAKDFKRGQLVKGVRGPQGLRGHAGQRGVTGVQGPSGSVSFAENGTTESPAAGPPSTTFQSVSLTTSTSGAVLAQARLDSLYMPCGGGGAACTIVVGLYVDGQPVPHSGLTLTSGCSPGCSIGGSNLVLAGVATGIAAGYHTVALAAKVTAGSLGTTTLGPVQLRAIGAG